LDNLSTGQLQNIHVDASLVKVDLTDFSATNQAITDAKPQAIYHLAAQVSVHASFSSPTHDADVNILGTLNLLQAAAALAEKPRIIFISSGGAVYGDAVELPSSELTKPNPATPYGIAKLAAELYVRLLSPSDHVILRLSNVYGPRQGSSKETGVCAVFAKQVLAEEPLTIFGDGSQTRDYVFVGDVANACALALANAGGQIINVSTGIETSAKSLADKIVAIAGKGSVTNLSARDGDVLRSCLTPALAERELGWKPTTDISAGIQETLDSFCA
jgi:UDP-glucose 4-epimerase